MRHVINSDYIEINAVPIKIQGDSSNTEISLFSFNCLLSNKCTMYYVLLLLIL